jgi:hypothetical protein
MIFGKNIQNVGVNETWFSITIFSTVNQSVEPTNQNSDKKIFKKIFRIYQKKFKQTSKNSKSEYVVLCLKK